METVPVALFILLMLAEIGVSIYTRNGRYGFQQTIANIGTGLLALLFDYGFSFLSLPFLYWLYAHARLFSWTQGPLYYVCLFLLLDFIEYWFHRISHALPLMWAGHKVHHQSREFNLSVGLRTSVLIPFFNIGFYCLMPVLGFEPGQVLSLIFAQGIYQLFVHTEAVPRLGWLDQVLVTPSVHRVHHGKNDRYIDKNFGKMLCIWDQLFGTYARETEKVVYGATDDAGEEGILRCQWMPVKKWYDKRIRRH